MVKNLWSKISIYCMDHEKPVRMYVYTGSETPFYACPRYMLKDDDHPDGHAPDEKGCANRASFEAVRHLVEELGRKIEEDAENGIVMDYTGTKLKWRQISAQVLSWTNLHISIGIRNSGSIGIWNSTGGNGNV